MIPVRFLASLAVAGGLAAPACAEAPLRQDAGTGLTYRLSGDRGPLVVFESATAEPMANWDAVVARLGPCLRALAYDRAGTGASAPLGTNPVLAGEVAARLRQLVRDARLPGPYILVGHLIGGLYAQAFARAYPESVAALVLVDAASPLEPPNTFVPTQPSAPGTVAAAEESGVAASMEALRKGPALPPVPLIVLAATRHDDTPAREALWQQVQAETAALSPRGRRIVVEGSHFLQTERPEAVAAAIREAAGAAGFDTA